MKNLVRETFMAIALTGMMAGTVSAAECIAPAHPGGGWDFTCRQIGKIMYDIGAVDRPIQVTNMGGAGGGVAFAYVVSERDKDDALIVAASSETTTRLAQHAYAGMTANQVRFVGAIGADPGVLLVAGDSPYQSLDDVVKAIKADPGSVAFAGGSAAGGLDHLKVLMVLQRAGFKDITRVRYISMDSDADAIARTIGGFTQVATGDLSGAVGFLKSGDVRAVAVLTEERVPGFKDIPTAKEQGFNAVAVNWRGLYIPKGVSDQTFNMWTERLRKVARSHEWSEAMAANGLAPFTKIGEDFQSYVDEQVAEIERLSKQIGVIR